MLAMTNKCQHTVHHTLLQRGLCSQHAHADPCHCEKAPTMKNEVDHGAMEERDLVWWVTFYLHHVNSRVCVHHLPGGEMLPGCTGMLKKQVRSIKAPTPNPQDCWCLGPGTRGQRACVVYCVLEIHLIFAHLPFSIDLIKHSADQASRPILDGVQSDFFKRARVLPYVQLQFHSDAQTTIQQLNSTIKDPKSSLILFDSWTLSILLQRGTCVRMHVQYVHTAHTPLATVSLATLDRRQVRCQFNCAGGCDVSQQSRGRRGKTKNVLQCKSWFMLLKLMKQYSLVHRVQTVLYLYTFLCCSSESL